MSVKLCEVAMGFTEYALRQKVRLRSAGNLPGHWAWIDRAGVILIAR
jgi:hypothetical protein